MVQAHIVGSPVPPPEITQSVRASPKPDANRTQMGQDRGMQTHFPMPSTDLRVLLFRAVNSYHITPFSQKAPPLGLLTLAAQVRRDAGCEVRLMDGAEGDSLQALKREVENWRPHIVGISTLTANSYDGMVAATVAKSAFADTLTVAGGIHFSAVPEESLRVCTDFDVCAIGEGELTLVDLCQVLAEAGGRGDRWREDLAGVAGLAWLEGSGPGMDEHGQPTDRAIHYTAPRRLIKDLSILPMPAYDLHTPSRYKMWPWKWHDMTLAEGSRGCPYKCSFCHNSQFWEYRWRARPVEAVLDELEYLSNTLGHSNIYFVDDSFQTKRSRIIEMCEGILRRGIKVKSWAQCRVDDLHRDRDLFPLMKRAGFYGLLIGFESPRQSDLDRWHKQVGVGQAIELAPHLAKNFDTIMGTFMVGDHTCGIEDFDKTREFAESLQVDIMLMMPFTPVPASIPMWEQYKGIPDLDVEWDYDLAGIYRGGVSTSTLDRQTVLTNNAKQLGKFYFNPKHALHALQSGRLQRRHFFHFIVSGLVDIPGTKLRTEFRSRDPRPKGKLRELYKQRQLSWCKRLHKEGILAAAK